MDISCKNDSFRFRVRSAGVLLQNGRLLLQRERNGSVYALPGGTLKLGESTEESLLREWKEETGADIGIDRLLWIEESFWAHDGRTDHSLVFYYRIHLEGGAAIADDEVCMPQRDNAEVLFEWVPLARIGELLLYPAFAKNELFSLGEGTKRFVTRE